MEINDLAGLGKLSESASNALAKSFGPLLKPMLTEIGQAISDPVRRIRFEREIQWYQRLEQAGHYIESAGKSANPVNPKILLPIAEYASLETDEYLQEMWSRLIASALTDEEIHPSFVEVLKQLTPLEARVFNLIGHRAPSFSAQQIDSEHTEFTIFLALSGEMGISDIADKIIGRRFNSETNNIEEFSNEEKIKLDQKIDMVSYSLENLQRVGLLSVPERHQERTLTGALIIPWGAFNLLLTPFGRRFRKAINGPIQS